MASAFDRLDDLTVRLYLASIIGPSRAPFGTRKQATLRAGQTTEIASNSTHDRAVHVTVTRADQVFVGNAVASVVFTQYSEASANDFPTLFPSAGGPGISIYRFVLKPGDSLSLFMPATSIANAAIPFVFALETF